MPENATRTKPRIECNIAAQLEAKKAEHDAANRPASWFQLKLAVGLVFAIFGYALYVFLVRSFIARSTSARTISSGPHPLANGEAGRGQERQ